MMGTKLGRWLALLAVLGATGCASPGIRRGVEGYGHAIEEGGEAIGAWFAAINDFERELWFEELALDGSLEVLATDAGGRPTPLLGRRFDAAAIQARRDAVDLLAAHARRLAGLAGSDAPAEFRESAEALGEGVTGLVGTLRSLSGRGDAGAEAYVGPVSSLLGLLGEAVLEARREAALARAVQDGAPAVRAVLDLLERDLGEVVAPLRRTGLHQLLAIRVADYNAQRGKWSAERRRSALKELRLVAARYEEVLAVPPESVVDTIRTAHEALVRFAASPREDEDLDAALETLEDVVRRIDRFAEAVAALRAAGRGDAP